MQKHPPQSEPTKTEEGGNAEAPNVPTIKANSDNDTQTQFSEAPTRNDLARKEDIPAVSKTRNYNHHNQTLTVK